MSKLEQLRRDAGDNIGESMGGGRAAIGAIPRVSAGGPPPKPARPDSQRPRSRYGEGGTEVLRKRNARHLTTMRLGPRHP